MLTFNVLLIVGLTIAGVGFFMLARGLLLPYRLWLCPLSGLAAARVRRTDETGGA